MSERIDHVAEALRCVEETHFWMEREGDTAETQAANIAEAQVHATLALVEQQRNLVEQQRIANLIAFNHHFEPSIDSSGMWFDENAGTGKGAKWVVKPEYREALGL